ncbi:MAG: hypothetical protein LBT01_06060 [Spirochaetaceae bacterium]|nr:hypothetical protein [Spirochaetaceae bacterium]
MKITITGHIVSIDYARQSFNIKPRSRHTQVTVYADEKVFTKLAYRVEKDRLDGKNETRGTFIVSGKVLSHFVTGDVAPYHESKAMNRLFEWLETSRKRRDMKGVKTSDQIRKKLVKEAHAYAEWLNRDSQPYLMPKSEASSDFSRRPAATNSFCSIGG